MTRAPDSGSQPPDPSGLFALDLRALAALRISLGVLIIFDLIWRAGDYAAHYGDGGVLPAQVLLDRYLHPGQFCFHARVDGAAELALWLVQGAAAFCLLLGYRTRTAAAVTWVLLLSLQTRNYMVLQAGDVALRMFLFWGIFLPLGARWSVDAALRGQPPPVRSIRTMATMAVVIQLALIYAVATASKMSHPVWWRDGMGVYYALSTREFTTGLGYWLREFPTLLELMTYGTLVVQVSVPVLLLSPYRNHQLRTAAAAVLIPMHILFMLTLSIGLFSYIVCTVWLTVLAPGVWDRIEARLPRLRLRRPGGLLGRIIEREQRRVRARPHPVQTVCSSWLARGLLGLLIVYSIWWNISVNRHFAMPEAVQPVARFLRFEQRWHMFSNPPRQSGWYVVEGRTADDQAIDPRTGDPPSYDEPAMISASFPGQRWRKYITNLDSRNNLRHRALYLDYLCRSWNQNHPDRRIERITLTKMQAATPPPGQPFGPARMVELAANRCQ